MLTQRRIYYAAVEENLRCVRNRVKGIQGSIELVAIVMFEC